MAYKVESLEQKLTQLCFEARRELGKARKAGNRIAAEYWRGKDEAYTNAARLAEEHGA